MQRDKTRLKLLSFLLNPFTKPRRKPGRDQAGLCYLGVPHPQATPRSLSGVHFLWGQGQEWACAGPALEACSSPAHTQTCQAQPQTCWQNKQRQTQGPDLAWSARGRPAPAPALSPRGRAASEPRAPAHAQPFQGDRHGPHTKALAITPPLAPRRMRSRGSYRLRLQSHTEFFQNRWAVRSPSKLPGQRDREKLCFRGRRSPVGRGARHAPRAAGNLLTPRTAAPRGVANSPDPRSCAGRARLPVLPARGRRSTRSSLPAARPASPVPAPGPPPQACPARPTRGGGEPEVPAAARPGRASDRPPAPAWPRRAPPRLPRNSASRLLTASARAPSP